MALSVYCPHGGYDEVDYVTTLEGIRVIMEEGRGMGAKDFFVGGDLHTELRGPECRGGGEDEVTYEKNYVGCIY